MSATMINLEIDGDLNDKIIANRDTKRIEAKPIILGGALQQKF